MPCGSNAIENAGRGGQSIVNINRRAPDSMRHGGMDFEVVGDDRAADHVPRDRSEVSLSPTITNPATNQAGMMAPHTSPYGQAMKRGAATDFVREMNPIIRVKGFPNNVGTNSSQGPRNIVVVADPGYDGILPLSQQPLINKPLPY